MKKRMLKIGDAAYPYIQNITLIGDWEEVDKKTAEEIRKGLGNEKLDGMIIRGYEMKWGVTNGNYERYEQTAFDDFIKSYFVDRSLNMPVDINHEGCHNWQSIAGRVLYIERNSVGFYFAIYVPRGYAYYEQLKWAISNGIIQGFSKEGYATDYEYKYNEDGSFAYELVKSMKLLSVSLVATPANGVPFEKAQEIKNSLQYIVEEVEDKPSSEEF